MSGADKADRMPLGGLIKRKVIRDLALSGLTQAAIAEKYGVTPGAITQFKQRNAQEIQAVAAAADDDYAGILIAEKAARLAAYQDIHERAMEPTPKITNKGTVVVDPVTGEYVYEINAGAAMTALKSAAEEMGQLPTRLQIQGDMQTTTTYRIENVEPGALE